MIMTPTSFTHEYLSGMKFKELQKLSVQFHVNKRWAKKQELIENLLALKGKEKTINENNQDEEKEWRDGSTVFKDSQQNNEIDGDRRLTFNVNTKPNVEHTDPRLTFNVSHNGKNLLGEAVNSRETYDTTPSITDLGVEPLLESRATFEVPPKKNLVQEVDPRATFDIPQNGKKLLEENEANITKNMDEERVGELKKNSNVSKKECEEFGIEQNLGNSFSDVNVRNGEEKKSRKGRTDVKTLTIPYARVTRRTRKDGESSRANNTPIKMSKKSINIKKSTRVPMSKTDIMKSPAFSSVKSSINKQTIIRTLTKPQPGKITQSRVPVRLQFDENKPTVNADEDNKENSRKILRKRISKTADETLGIKTNYVKVNFRTPPPSLGKNTKAMPVKKTPSRKEADARLNKSATATPGVKPTIKPITTTKMPDFSKIHKKQFAQMDSLHDYLKKKEERARKLFGTPQPGQQLHVLNKTAPVFRFQSTTVEKENKGSESIKALVTPLKRKENESKTAQKEAVKNKLPPLKLRTEIKDKNRSHIHGVRTNKRFELQMKFRNM